MSDIVERLENVDVWNEPTGKIRRLCREAALEIRKLRPRLDYMENKYGKVQWDARVPQATVDPQA